MLGITTTNARVGGFRGLGKIAKLILAYFARVIAAGGVTEGRVCLENSLKSLDTKLLLDNASLVLIPSGYKAGVIYSQVPTSGLGDLDVVRATTATRVNSSALIETSAIATPRLDYTNSSCPSLLVEPQRTNLATYSEEFDNVSWAKNSSTITANTATAPNGILTADSLNVTTVTFSGMSKSIVGVLGNYNISIYAKKNTKNWLYFIDVQGGNARAWFNLDTGVLGTVASGYTATITNAGNGWYRCTMSNNTAQTLAFYQLGLSDANNSNTPLSNGSAFVWGAQVELGSYATSYIPTVAAAVTRNAETISKTGISSLINSQQGVIYYEGSALANNTTARFIELNETLTTLTNNVYFRYEPTANLVAFTVFSGGTLQCNINYSLPLTQTGNNKFAFVWALNRFEIWVNGSKVAEDTLGNPPVASSLNKIIFYDRNGINNFEGRVNSLVIYQTALSNAQLASLTTL